MLLLLLLPCLFLLIPQIAPTRPQVDNLGAPIPIPFRHCALVAIIRVRDPVVAADDALACKVAKAALVANVDQGCGPHVRVADGTLVLALLAEAANGRAGLFHAVDEVGVVP